MVKNSSGLASAKILQTVQRFGVRDSHQVFDSQSTLLSVKDTASQKKRGESAHSSVLNTQHPIGSKRLGDESKVRFFKGEILLQNCEYVANLWRRNKITTRDTLKAEDCLPVI
jgi:hypothetical protein